MDFIEAEGKTEEEAVERALRRTGAREEDVKIERCDSQSEEGYTKIRVFYDKKKTDSERAKAVLEAIFERMNIEAELEISEREEGLYVNIISPDSNLLIGHKGETINALQYIVNRTVNKDLIERARIILDTDNYREKHRIELESLARAEALKAKETGREISLPPMSSEERRIIHLALRDDEEIGTESIGEDPYRKVVISLKKQ
jgi:spoIIIJ-associated protein